MPFGHEQRDWETANPLSFCPLEHQCSQSEWFFRIAMMKSWTVLAFCARLSHIFLEGEHLKRGENKGFPPRSETQDGTGHPVVPYPEKVQDFSHDVSNILSSLVFKVSSGEDLFEVWHCSLTSLVNVEASLPTWL